jgi:hypothetical protein
VFERSTRVAALAALVFGIAAGPLHGQAALIGPGAAFISGGVSQLATGDLDDRLAAEGYPTFGRKASTLGIGAYRIFSDRILVGFEGHGFIVGDEEHQGRTVGLSGGYATLGVGYVFTVSPRVRLYPRIGIGAAGIALEMESDAGPVDFDDVLTGGVSAPLGRDPVLSRDGVALDIGAGIELLRSSRSIGPLIGLRVGYLAAPFDSSWDYYERASYVREATEGPDATPSGPYIRIVIGGSWRR